MQKLNILVLAIVAGSALGCGQNLSTGIDSMKSGLGGDHGNFRPKVCSNLPFNGVNWPTHFTDPEKNADVLAFNISGSFEGSTGWGNITDNFDHQGVSLGLLNQCLGQGSLQPMLLQMRDSSLSVLQSIFSSAHLSSLVTMLDRWQGKAVSSMSLLDTLMKVESTASDLSSVQWAVNNLYSNGRFIPQWKNELTAMANTQNYVDVQAHRAFVYHQAAMTYMKELQVRQVRAFLLLFDIVVQDGSISTQNFNEYHTWLSGSPRASETQKLIKIIDIRQSDVSSQWQAAFRARKMSIVNGVGVVNGEKRQLEKEYCYDGQETLLN